MDFAHPATVCAVAKADGWLREVSGMAKLGVSFTGVIVTVTVAVLLPKPSLSMALKLKVAVPVALSADADEIKWFYEFRNFSADVIIEDECATAEVSSGPIAMKRYQFCQLRGLVWSEALPASGRPARIELLDNCGIRSAPECETAVPPVPLALPTSADRFAPPGPSG